MFTKESDVDVESRLALAMLQEALINDEIKQVLLTIAHEIKTKLLQPLLYATQNATAFDQLSINHKNAIIQLAIKHSAEDRQFGACFYHMPDSKSVISSMENITSLLKTLEKVLTNVMYIQTIDDVLMLLKVINDFGTGYVENLRHLHSPFYPTMESMINPTPEEFDVRLTRLELGQPKQFSLTYGLGTIPDQDLVQADTEKGRERGKIAGKSIFGALSMEKRLEVIIKQYDETFLSFTTLQNELKQIEIELTQNRAKLQLRDELLNKLKDVEAKLQKLVMKMQYYKIPLEKESRQDLSVYAKETTLEKLAKQPSNSLLLIASVSGSAARAFIMFCDIGVFNNECGFDFRKAQIIANSLLGFYITAGHHSFLEVAESYNRMLDYIVLYRQNLLLKNIIPLEPNTNKPYADADDVVEKKLPYYVIGDYRSFLHEAYEKNVLQAANLNDLPVLEKLIRRKI